MTTYTPSGGALAMSQINAVFGRGTNLNAYRGTQWVQASGAAGAFSSGALAFSEFYSKSPHWYFVGNLYYTGNLGGTIYGGFIDDGGYGATLFVGPHHCYGRINEYAAIQFGFEQRIAFPNGRPSTFCRLHIQGITDQTTSNYDGRFFRFAQDPGFFSNQTRTTEIFLFN
jgi:hypothetical protein